MGSAREWWERQMWWAAEKRAHDNDVADRAADKRESAWMLTPAPERPVDMLCVCGRETRHGLCNRCREADEKAGVGEC